METPSDDHASQAFRIRQAQVAHDIVSANAEAAEPMWTAFRCPGIGLRALLGLLLCGQKPPEGQELVWRQRRPVAGQV